MKELNEKYEKLQVNFDSNQVRIKNINENKKTKKNDDEIKEEINKKEKELKKLKRECKNIHLEIESMNEIRTPYKININNDSCDKLKEMKEELRKKIIESAQANNIFGICLYLLDIHDGEMVIEEYESTVSEYLEISINEVKKYMYKLYADGILKIDRINQKVILLI